MNNQNSQLKFETSDVVDIYSKVFQGGSEELRKYMIRIGRKNGLDLPRSTEIAEQIINAVDHYESTREMLEENAEEAMKPFFDSLNCLSSDKRVSVLDRFLFGLEAASDEHLCSAITEKDDLFGIRYGNKGDLVYCGYHLDPETKTENEEDLKAAILKKVGNLNLSSGYIKRVTMFALVNGDYTATAAALGRNGYSLKCIASMQYLCENQESMDVNTAVAQVSAGVDVQALGDAVYRGMMTEKIAKIILTTVVIAVGWVLVNKLYLTVSSGISTAECLGDVERILKINGICHDYYATKSFDSAMSFSRIYCSVKPITEKWARIFLLDVFGLYSLPRILAKAAIALPKLIQKNTGTNEKGLEMLAESSITESEKTSSESYENETQEEVFSEDEEDEKLPF